MTVFDVKNNIEWHGALYAYYALRISGKSRYQSIRAIIIARSMMKHKTGPIQLTRSVKWSF